MGGVITLYTKQGRILPCFFHASLSSTGSEAKRIARESGEERFSVAAAEQTAGRGREGRPFLSLRDRGVYLSFVCEAKGMFTRFGVLSALAVRALLEEYFELDARFKWPNDVVVQDKKICGILPESIVASDGRRKLVTGVGINLFEREEEFGGLSDIATSAVLCCKNDALKHEFEGDRRAFIMDASVRLTELLSRLADLEERGEDLIGEYKDCLVTLGRKVRFAAEGGGEAEGVAEDVAPDGALLVRTCRGLVRVGWGEVTEQEGLPSSRRIFPAK